MATAELPITATITQTTDGTILGWDRGAEEIYGFTAEEAVGAIFALLVADGAGSGLADHLRSGGGPRRFERDAVHLRSDGRKVEVVLTVSVIEDADGVSTERSLVIQEVRERPAPRKATN